MPSEILLEKEATSESEKIIPLHCPVCGVDTNYVYCTMDKDNSDKAFWFRCPCGIIFQRDPPAHNGYDEKYIAGYAGAKEFVLRNQHAARTYVNLIEELTYGRMMLDVGFCSLVNMDFFKERGWLTWGIDVNPTLTGKGNLYKGDFMAYDFEPTVQNEELKQMITDKEIHRTFDLIWMGHVFEHFADPIAALNKAFNLLSPDGVLYISTPDIDFIAKTGVSTFPHWKKNEHYIMWSEPALKREVERLGFKVIVSRRNFASRFSAWYDIQLLAQKNYF